MYDYFICLINKDIPLSDLYTFIISLYELLDITHVHRKEELPSLQDNTYNYQRLLNSEKLKKIQGKSIRGHWGIENSLHVLFRRNFFRR